MSMSNAERCSGAHVPVRGRRRAIAVALVLLAAPPAAGQTPFRLGVGVGLATAYDSNVEHRFDGVAALSVAGAGDLELRRAGRRTDVRLAYAIAHHHYEIEPSRNRTTHDARIGLGYAPSRRYTLSMNLESSIGRLSEDRELGTQHSLTPRLDIRLDERNRLRLRSLHRLRRFGERSGRDVVNHGAGLDYRIGASRQPTLELATRYDQTHTTDPRSRFRRWSHRATFTAPLGSGSTLTLVARQTTRTYPDRHVGLEPIAELDLLPEERRILDHYTDAEPLRSIPFERIPDEVLLRWRDLPRRDEIWAPHAALTLRPAGVELRIAYDLEVRLSNDLRRGYTAHQFELGSRWKVR
jgi:hypothetical protein